MTQREKIESFIKENPGKSAAEIATATEIKIQNVTAVLVKQINQHKVKRLLREDPKGRDLWTYFPV